MNVLYKNRSIRLVLILSVIILNIFMITLLLYSLESSNQRKEKLAEKTAENITLLIKNNINSLAEEIDLSLDYPKEYIQDIENNDISAKELQERLIDKTNKTAIDNFYITDNKGKIKFTTSKIDSPIFHENLDFFNAIKENPLNKLFVTKLIKNPDNQHWVILFARPYFNSNNQFAGIISATVPADLFNRFTSGVDIGSNGVILIQDTNMRIIARSLTVDDDSNKVGHINAPQELSRLIKSNIETGILYAEDTLDHVPRIGYFNRMDDMPVFVATALSPTDYLSEWYKNLLKAFIVELIFLVVTIFAAIFIWHQIKVNISGNLRNKMLLKHAQDGTHILDINCKLIDGSDSFFRMIGQRPEQALGKTPEYWDGAYSFEEIKNILSNEPEMEKGIRLETSYKNAQGQFFPVEVSIILVEINNSKLYFCSSRDISDEKNAIENQRIAATAFDSQMGILITDANLIILRANKAVTEITGYSQQELIGQSSTIFRSDKQTHIFYKELRKAIKNNATWRGEIWGTRKSGELYPQFVLISNVYNHEGKTTHYVISFTDISAYKASEEKAYKLEFYDSTTKLPNRRLFIKTLEKCLTESKSKNQLGALLFINLNHFRLINDTKGYDSGNQLLQQVSMRLSKHLPHNMVARLGSDEFVVLCENLGHSEETVNQEAEKITKSILNILNQSYTLTDCEYYISVRIGISIFGLLEHENAQNLIQYAEMAMSSIKGQWKNEYSFFEPFIQKQVLEQAETENSLREAIEKNQFQLFYQPQVDVNEKIIGVEALIRWKHPVKGDISPAQFIPIAEENGLIITIGYWVLETACKQLNTWKSDRTTQHLTLAVNVSTIQFAREEFVTELLDILRLTGAPPDRLKIEITESTLAMHLEDLIHKVNKLKHYGISFSLDDFGTGYSSLNYLKNIPLDQLKIDRSFIRDIVTNEQDQMIAKMIISLAKVLNISVIAEGVETDMQRTILEQNGCYHYQGYLFGAPMPIEVFEAYLQDKI